MAANSCIKTHEHGAHRLLGLDCARRIVIAILPEVFMRRTLDIFVFAVVFSTSAAAWIWLFPHKTVKNPLADVNSKKPAKVLCDRAMDSMGHLKCDIAGLSLQT